MDNTSDKKAEKKQSRKAKAPRSRTGCRICRARHIKCDETRPSCRNCRISGRVCDGVGPRSDSGDRSPPSTSLGSDASLAQGAVLPEEIEERSHFFFFQQLTGPELSGYFDAGFYNELMLQISRQKPAIRHAVIALGALHESVKVQEQPGGRLKNLSLHHYTNAIQRLKQTQMESHQSVSTTLICCILFIWLETLQGNHKVRMQQLTGGLKILSEWQKTVVTASSIDPEVQFIRNHLVPLFTRMDLQGVSFEKGRKPQLELHRRLENPRSRGMPAVFSSGKEARDWQDVIMYWLHNAFHSHRDTASFQEEGQLFLEQWEVALNEYTRTQDWITPKEHRSCDILRIYQKMCTIMLITRMSHNEADYEPLTPQFRAIMTLVSALFLASGGTGTLDGYQFSFEMGVVAPLFYLSSKCQNQEVRTRAVMMLVQCPRRGGVWDGLGVAKMSSMGPEGTVDSVLEGEENQWARRYDVAVGSTRGVIWKQ